MKRKKSRQTKRVYLVRIIRELWEKIPAGQSLRINKVRAYCLDRFDADFSFERVRDAFWAFYAEVNHLNSGVNPYAAVPELDGHRFIGLIKIGSDDTDKRTLAAHRRTTAEKDGQRVRAHREYLEADVHKRLMTSGAAAKLIAAAGFDPMMKALPPHAQMSDR